MLVSDQSLVNLSACTCEPLSSTIGVRPVPPQRASPLTECPTAEVQERHNAPGGSPAVPGMSTGLSRNSPGNLRVSRGPAARTAAGLVLGAICLASCGASASRSASGAPAGPSLPTPLATSVEGGGVTWVTVPMGNLRQPANTFWQLFFRRVGRHLVQPGRGHRHRHQRRARSCRRRPLAVGRRAALPSPDLTPLISTADAGRSWSTGLISQGLSRDLPRWQ